MVLADPSVAGGNMTRLLFADAHLHCNPVRGLGSRRIAEMFKSKGGWFVALVGLSPWHYGLKGSTLEDYKKAYEIHIKSCKEAREAGVKVSCFVGFHPADVDKLIDAGMQPEKVLELGLNIIEYAAKLCKEGVIDGIGEVGRQHFTTSPERVAISIEIMTHALELARDYDCLAHLHLENAGVVTAVLIDVLAKRLSLKRSRILLHHCKPVVAETALRLGFATTIPGKKPILEYVFRNMKEHKYMVESDFIDDPKRPCVSSCPWDVVDNELELLNLGVVDEEVLWRINVDNIVRFYGVEPP